MPCDIPNRMVAMYSFKVKGNRKGESSEAKTPLWEREMGKEAKSGFLKEKKLGGSSSLGTVNSFYFWCQL